MSDSTVTSLTAASALTGTELFYAVQSGSKKATAAQILTYVQSVITRASLGAAASGANSDITSLTGLTTPLTVAQGGTGATTAGTARSALSAAGSGANSDITALSGLTTALSIAQGGTGAATALAARTALSLAREGTGSSNPTPTTDAAAGYVVGSIYVNSATSVTFACRDATTGAAVWNRVTAPEFPGYISGRYYVSIPGAQAASGVAGFNTAVYLCPFPVYERVTISELAARVAVVSTSGNFMLGVYANNYAIGRPTGTPVASVTGLSTTTATTVSAALGANVTLEPGLYWAAVQHDNGTSTIQSTAAASSVTSSLIGSATLANVSGGAAMLALTLSVTNTYGTFPDLTAASFIETTATVKSPILIFKVA